METKTRILLIDDQIGETGSPHQRAFIRGHSGLPFEFRFASARNGNGYSVNAALDSSNDLSRIDLVLLDINFGETNNRLGLEILHELGSRHPELPVLVLSAVDRDVAVLGRCLEGGAIGFVEKAAKPQALRDAVEHALEIAHSHILVGKAPALRELRRQAARLSPYDQIPVLIVGERGTGKERVARYIHHNGPRRDKSFVAVNCAAIPETLLEAEFFGAETGAYTGATSRRVGYFERAHGGLLFLDEIGDMPLTTQAKLLRVLQDGTYRRIGSSEEELKADFQLLCATNVEPIDLLTKGRLREDFYDRITAVTVNTPPLRECKADIPELAEHFLRQLGLAGKKRLSRPVLDAFAQFDWPGNVRQLQRAIQEAVVRSEDDPKITVKHLPGFIHPSHSSVGTAARSSVRTTIPDDPSEWPRARLIGEIELALEAKRRIQDYKGSQWKAEFMRLMYPHCKAANAKGFDDLIRRLTQGPWGEPNTRGDEKIRARIAELKQ
jgi:two-component system, NtrC family, nitrogen regulation response regulator GlnG